MITDTKNFIQRGLENVPFGRVFLRFLCDTQAAVPLFMGSPDGHFSHPFNATYQWSERQAEQLHRIMLGACPVDVGPQPPLVIQWGHFPFNQPTVFGHSRAEEEEVEYPYGAARCYSFNIKSSRNSRSEGLTEARLFELTGFKSASQLMEACRDGLVDRNLRVRFNALFFAKKLRPHVIEKRVKLRLGGRKFDIPSPFVVSPGAHIDPIIKDIRAVNGAKEGFVDLQGEFAVYGRGLLGPKAPAFREVCDEIAKNGPRVAQSLVLAEWLGGFDIPEKFIESACSVFTDKFGERLGDFMHGSIRTDLYGPNTTHDFEDHLVSESIEMFVHWN
jgi:hypothetical protein